MKKFNLDEYLKLRPNVFTADGREARIICTDNEGEFPIVALVENMPLLYTKDGSYLKGVLNGTYELFLDLTTEFEGEIDELLIQCAEDLAPLLDDLQGKYVVKNYRELILDKFRGQYLNEREPLKWKKAYKVCSVEKCLNGRCFAVQDMLVRFENYSEKSLNKKVTISIVRAGELVPRNADCVLLDEVVERIADE